MDIEEALESVSRGSVTLRYCKSRSPGVQESRRPQIPRFISPKGLERSRSASFHNSDWGVMQFKKNQQFPSPCSTLTFVHMLLRCQMDFGKGVQESRGLGVQESGEQWGQPDQESRSPGV